MELKRIAVIYTDFSDKFGIPRQSGLTGAKGRIVFEEEYRLEEAVRGIEEFSHLWLLWGFSEVMEEKFRPTVRPPRLGGNKRIGVFATRSPFRPNRIGLSCVRLTAVQKHSDEGPILYVEGVDILDGTPIYDIKPYLPYVDSQPNALGGFAQQRKDYALELMIPVELEEKIPEEHRRVVHEILSQDPRPSYQNDPDRVYGMSYAGLEIKFRVDEGQLEVLEIKENR